MRHEQDIVTTPLVEEDTLNDVCCDLEKVVARLGVDVKLKRRMSHYPSLVQVFTELEGLGFSSEQIILAIHNRYPNVSKKKLAHVSGKAEADLRQAGYLFHTQKSDVKRKTLYPRVDLAWTVIIKSNKFKGVMKVRE